MADISGTNLAAKIVPFTTDDTYPTHEDIYGIGGLMCVADVSARNAISSNRRKEGMKVAVISEGITYELKGGITNSYWYNFLGDFINQINEPSLNNNIFSFWNSSSDSSLYLVAKINNLQKKLLLKEDITILFEDYFDNWSGGLPVGWELVSSACGINGTIARTGDAITFSTNVANANPNIVYKNVIPPQASSVKFTVEITAINCEWNDGFQMGVLYDLSTCNFSSWNDRIKTIGTYSLTFNRSSGGQFRDIIIYLGKHTGDSQLISATITYLKVEQIT
jgi:hypothetical protein